MSNDPFKAGIQCVLIVGLVLSVLIYLTGWRIDQYPGSDALFLAFGLGYSITVYLTIGAVALWVTSGFFK